MAAPQLLSIQVGMPARHGADAISDQPWLSGIFKARVDGPVWVGALNLSGDGQADLKNHGGPFRAALGYAASHYPVWRQELALPHIPYGAFGENFTLSELDEESVCLGDIYQIGEVRLQVTQPRQPCWKLARRWGLKDLTARVHDKGWGGWYYRVLQEGYVEAGMPAALVERPFPQFSIFKVNALMNEWLNDPQATAELAALEPLSPGWRAEFLERARAARRR